MKWWIKIRLPIMVTLMTVAAFAAGRNLGHREGISEQIGGPGTFQTALVEWRDINRRKVVLYLNDGANGFATWLELKPEFRHYTVSCKVFVSDNTNYAGIRTCLEFARDWCDNEWEGGDTRVTGGDLKPRADDGDDIVIEDKDLFSRERQRWKDDRDALQYERAANMELLLERDRLRRKLGLEE